jgi:hypothetical protein
MAHIVIAYKEAFNRIVPYAIPTDILQISTLLNLDKALSLSICCVDILL